MSQTFIKNQEDFTCEHCGAAVVGNGYTNHCPKCLWSKHVDNFPGDRVSACGGLMRPTGYERVGGEFVVLQRCERCGVEKKNKLSAEDDLAHEPVRLAGPRSRTALRLFHPLRLSTTAFV